MPADLALCHTLLWQPEGLWTEREHFESLDSPPPQKTMGSATGPKWHQWQRCASLGLTAAAVGLVVGATAVLAVVAPGAADAAAGAEVVAGASEDAPVATLAEEVVLEAVVLEAGVLISWSLQVRAAKSRAGRKSW
jgi:hypothetical protein